MSTSIVTSITAGLFGIVQVALSFSIISVRREEHISLGDGGNKLLERRIRGHGNFTENVPVALILLYLVEQQVTSKSYVITLATLIVAGRLSHAWAFLYIHEDSTIFRVGGMVATLTMIILSSITLLYLSLY